MYVGADMFEKNMSIGVLLDFYGEILNERKRNILSMYYNEDLSLNEIAGIIGISRQGVRDIIKKAENELLFYEDKLGLANKFRELRRCSDRMTELSGKTSLPEDLVKEIKYLSSIIQ